MTTSVASKIAKVQSKPIKVPGAKMPKLSAKLPSVPKAPQLGTATQNLQGYKVASKNPLMGMPKLPKGL